MRREEKQPTDAASTNKATYDSFLLAKEKKVKRKGRKRKRVSSNEGSAPSRQDLEIPKGHVDLPQPDTRVDDEMCDAPPADSDMDATTLHFNPQEGGDLQMVTEINNEISSNADISPSEGGSVVEIIAHRWKEGRLQLKIIWNTEENTWEEFRDLKEDKPRLTAQYIIDKNVTRSKRGPDRNFQWAKKTLRDLERANRRLRRLYEFYLDDSDHVRYIRRTNNKRKKKKFKGFAPKQFKDGLEVPKNVKQGLELDRLNGDSYWADAIKKEVQALTDLDCFEFKDRDFKLDLSY